MWNPKSDDQIGFSIRWSLCMYNGAKNIMKMKYIFVENGLWNIFKREHVNQDDLFWSNTPALYSDDCLKTDWQPPADCLEDQGAFNNYMDKMRGEGVKKCLFLSTLKV